MKTSKFWSDVKNKGHPLLKGKYLVQNPLLYFFLKTTDLFFSFFQSTKISVNKFPPKKILFSHTGHLGDLVIATSVLPIVKKAFPQAEIGFIVGSWSRMVVENHPLVDHIHILDHWKNNRLQKSFWKKVFQYIKTFCSSFQELRKEKYDVAIDLNFYFPNSIFFLACAGIGHRIGYTSGGFGSLLTDGVEWAYQEQYIMSYHQTLLKKLGIEESHLQNMKPCLCPVSENEQQSLQKKLSKHPQEKGYVIIHMGAGHEKKQWEKEKWKDLSQRLSSEGLFLVFTGMGAKEKEAIHFVMQDLGNAQSLCDCLSWQELVFLIQKAKLIISVDTVVTHIAFAFGVKTIILSSGIHSIAHWNPPGAKTIFAPLACFPCFDITCSARRCLSLIKEEDVFLKAKEFLCDGAS